MVQLQTRETEGEIDIRLPYGLQTYGREVYYATLQSILSWRGLDLERYAYPRVMIVVKKKAGIHKYAFTCIKNIIVAEILSDLPIGEPDDNCNEFNPESYHRKYNGLVIMLLDKRYSEKIQDAVTVARKLFNAQVLLICPE